MEERKIYFGSDWHFSKFKKKTKTMKYNYFIAKEIIEKYKKMPIKDDDIFIFLGDLSYIGKKNTPKIERCLEEIRHLPGIKVLIRGNHDEASEKKYRELGFKMISSRLEINNLVFTHIPCEIQQGEYNIHGHIHGNQTYWDVEALNHVDCFSGQFMNYPIELEHLLENAPFVEVDQKEIDNIRKTIINGLKDII